MSVDVIIPAYNPNLKYLQKAINSVKSQTWNGHKNIIVIDDCSKNNVEGFCKENKVTYLRNSENRGPGFSRNVGIKNSSSEFISFLDADDIWSDKKLELSIDSFKKNKNVGLTCGNYKFIIREDLRQSYYRRPPIINSDTLMNVNYVASGSVTIRRDCVDKVGLFNEDYFIAEDYDYWLRISEFFDVDYIHEVLYYYRIIPGGNSLTQRKDIQLNHLRNLEKIKSDARKRRQIV